MKKRNAVRAAFTLVELLVVMSIIAMLAGLLLPAVNQVRETGRRTECISNQRQTAFALINFESKARQLPGYATIRYYGTNGNSTQNIPYVWAILDELGRPDLKRAYSTGGARETVQITDTSNIGSLELLVCPSDTTALGNNGQMSYVANCGLWDTGSTQDVLGSSVFYYHGTDTNINPQRLNMTIAAIDSGDGSTQTLLVSESTDAQTWYGDPTEARVGMCWSLSETNTAYRINSKRTGTEPRAQSFHPGGVVASFADGHVQFVSDTISYNTWGKLHTPRGDIIGAGDQWYNMPLTEKLR